jgi:hypothetical protein
MNILNTLVAIGVGVTLVSGSAQARSLRSAHHPHFERWGNWHQHRERERAHRDQHDPDHNSSRSSSAHFEGWHPSRHEGTDWNYSHESQRHPHGNKHESHNGWHSGNFFREWRAGD